MYPHPIRTPVDRLSRRTNVPKADSSACNVCGEYSFAKNHEGFTVCVSCGTVASEEVYNRGIPYIAKDSESRNRKAYHGPGMSAMVIDWQEISGDLRKDVRSDMPLELRRAIYNQRRTQYQIIMKEYKVRLARVASKFNLSRVDKEELMIVFKKFYKAKKLVGRSLKLTLGSLVYLLAVNRRLPISKNEIMKYFGIKKPKVFTHSYREVVAFVNDLSLSMIGMESPTPKYMRFVGLYRKYAGEEGIEDSAITKVATNLSKFFDSGRDMGKDPVGIVGAFLYITSVLTGKK